MRKPVLFLSLVLLGGALFAFADLRGVFGVSERRSPDFVHLTFAFRGAVQRTPVPGVHVACVRPGIPSACTEKRGPKKGQTTVTLGVMRVTRRGLLFTHSTRYELGADGVVHFTFIAPNHARETLSVVDGEVDLGTTAPMTVVLTPVPE